MANTKYLASNKSILQKFAEVLARFFNGLLPNTRRDTYSAEVANSLVYFLSDHKISVPKAEKTISEKKSDTVTEAKKALEDAQKDIKPPISNEALGYNSELDDETNANNPKFTKMPLIEDSEYGYVYANKFPINLPGLDVYFSILNNGTVTAFDKRTAMSIVTINFEGEQSINDLFSVLETITPDEISDILNAPDFVEENQSEDGKEDENGNHRNNKNLKVSHNSVHDSEINKDKKGYVPIRMALEPSEYSNTENTAEYFIAYGKDISNKIENEMLRNRGIYIVKVPSGTYNVIDYQTGKRLINSGDTTIKETLEKVNHYFSKIRQEAMEEIFSKAQDIYKEVEDETPVNNNNKRENLNFAPTETNVKYKC